MKKTIDANGQINYFSDKKSLNAIQRFINSAGNTLNSALAKYTGTELTSAEREANAFSAEQAQLAREHDIFMSENKYQMETQSMMDAGINPALVYGGGNLVSTHATGAAAESVNPSTAGIGQLLEAMMSIARMPHEIDNLIKQNELLGSEAKRNEAEAENLAESTRGQQISNEFMQQTMDDRKEAIKLANSLSRADREKVLAQKDEAIASANKMVEEAKTEGEKRALYQAEKELRYMEAREIVEMMPYKKAYMQAQTSAEKAYATLLATQDAVQKSIYTDDYIQSIHDSAEYNALSADAKAKVNGVLAKIRTGEAIQPIELGDSAVAGFFEQIVNGAVTMPINNGIAAMANLLTIMPAVDAGMESGLNTPSRARIGFN